MVIRVEAAHVVKAILHDYLTSALALEGHEIRRADPYIPMHNNCTDDTLHIDIPNGSGDYEYEDEFGTTLVSVRNAGGFWTAL